MKLTILLFAGLRRRLGRDHLEIDVPAGTTAAALLPLIARAHPQLADQLDVARLAVDHEFVDGGAQLREGVEIALIPPVSGGHDGPAARLQHQPLQLEEALARVRHPGAGGTNIFIGDVRSSSHGKPIAHLEYEAYAPMALKVMGAIIARIEAGSPGVRLAIHHRLGRLEVGESAVIIAAAAPHRAEAFDACRAAIEALKREVPIWKREVAVDGETWFGRGP
jgi:molybdopterin converting factor subunit 1